MPTLKVEGDQLLRDGRPHLLISGAIHYFRVHPDLWEDRLKRLVALGCNTVETYVAWNFHAPSPDEVRFDGPRDLGRFIEIATELGLDVIVRPGPYICAEWEGGGFPGWLTRDPTVRLRCMDPDYLAAVDRWFDELLPVIVPRQRSHGGGVVAVQIENEYGSFGDDRRYLEYIRDGLIARGVDELLVTSDGPSRYWLQGGQVDGAWATLNFGSRVETVKHMASQELPGQPLMCMEFWLGWFDHWGEEHHSREPQSVADDLDAMLASNMSVNFYMGHGGTNFGLWAGANHDGELQPTTTSYDYDAPISEDGSFPAKFHAVREVIARYRELPALSDHLAELGISDSPAVMDPATINWRPAVSLRDLPLWQQAGTMYSCPPTFEDAGLERGMMLLRRDLELEPDSTDALAPLVLYGLADRAYVFVDGELVDVVQGPDPRVDLESHRDRLIPDGARRVVTVEILVENQARVNFGPHVGARKGIVKGVWHRVRYLNDWQVTCLPWEDLGDELAAQAASAAPSSRVPLVVTGTFEAPGGADSHLDVSGAGRGIVWIDDFCLGRYWNIGPQQSLYIPSPLLAAGTHRITVLELESDDPHFALTSQPLFGNSNQKGEEDV